MVPLPISAAACAVSGESSTTLPAPQLPAGTVVLAAPGASVTVPTALERPLASSLIAVLTRRGSFSSRARTRALIRLRSVGWAKSRSYAHPRGQPRAGDFAHADTHDHARLPTLRTLPRSSRTLQGKFRLDAERKGPCGAGRDAQPRPRIAGRGARRD